MKTILITGINGFLGSHLAKKLKSNYTIIGLEISTHDLFRLKDEHFMVYEANEKAINQLFNENEVDGIIHTATFYGRQNEAIKTLADANLFKPFHLLDKAIKHNCSFFINTDTVLDRFVSTYALTKRHFQEWLYLRKEEIKVVNIQLEHFYGPGCSNTNFITAMIEKLLRNEPSIDLTLGEQKRDFVFIEDVLSAYKIIIDKIDVLDKPYSEFQVATNQLITIRELMILLKELTQSKSELNFGAVPYRENELMYSHTDNSTLRALGWKANVDFKSGVLRLMRNLKL